MNESQELMQTLAKAIREAAVVSRALPLDKTLWTREEVAACLRVESRTSLDREMKKPGFPKARRIGSGRWIAAEVIEWAESQ